MSIQNWSDTIIAVELQNDPPFTDDLDVLLGMLKEKPGQDVVLDFRSVTVLNSSNIAKLLKLRKQVVIADGRQLRLCGLDTHGWGVFLVTGRDEVFGIADDFPMGLASFQNNRTS